jgi:hypothetical protein
MKRFEFIGPMKIYVGTAVQDSPERSSPAPSTPHALPGYARSHCRLQWPLYNFAALLLIFFLTTLAAAQTLTGTVRNATTRKPAAGDEVILLSLGQGMEESGRTHADAKGNFSFKVDNPQSPHLVRAVHQGATYHKMAPPGTASVDVDVYDVGKNVEGIQVVADVMRIQVEQGQLEIMRQFAVQNSSKPPRTQMNERNLEFYVPEGAQIVESSAMTDGGNPLNSAPVPVDDKKTRYAFVFPLRPGTTQFEVAYQLPYTGSANIDPKTIYPLEHFVALLPKTMQFTAAPGTNYETKEYPRQPDANIEVASGIKVGQPLAFKISGEGTLATGEGTTAPGPSSAAPPDTRPGGGLGPPIDAPDPLQKYRWWILGGFAVALLGGGVFVASRQQAANRAGRSKMKEFDPEEDESYAAVDVQPARKSSSMLLEGLKEELFQLEVDHKRGRITQQEYEKTKSALDQTLQHALKREAQKA